MVLYLRFIIMMDLRRKKMGPIIDITPLFPYRILMHIAEVFAYYNIAHSITKDKYHPAITIAAIFAGKNFGLHCCLIHLLILRPIYSLE